MMLAVPCTAWLLLHRCRVPCLAGHTKRCCSKIAACKPVAVLTEDMLQLSQQLLLCSRQLLWRLPHLSLQVLDAALHLADVRLHLALALLSHQRLAHAECYTALIQRLPHNRLESSSMLQPLQLFVHATRIQTVLGGMCRYIQGTAVSACRDWLHKLSRHVQDELLLPHAVSRLQSNAPGMLQWTCASRPARAAAAAPAQHS